MPGLVLYDLNRWMPGHGENGLSVKLEARTLTVTVRFDGKAEDEETKTLQFDGVSFHCVGAFPGVPSVAGKYDCDFTTGSVIEAENSELSELWVAYWAKVGLRRRCSHYVMFWGSENKVIHVIAESVELS